MTTSIDDGVTWGSGDQCWIQRISELYLIVNIISRLFDQHLIR